MWDTLYICSKLMAVTGHVGMEQPAMARIGSTRVASVSKGHCPLPWEPRRPGPQEPIQHCWDTWWPNLPPGTHWWPTLG